MKLAPVSANYYKKLGKSDPFSFLVFDGDHEFHDTSAWAFLQKYL